jgi:transcriptional regulator with XRE-family HTH domain
MSTENVETISPAQCRAARGLLNLTQPDLAVAAGIGLSTVVDFERSRRAVSPDAIHKMSEALEKKGVDFISERSGGGAGVRFRKRQKAKE